MIPPLISQAKPPATTRPPPSEPISPTNPFLTLLRRVFHTQTSTSLVPVPRGTKPPVNQNISREKLFLVNLKGEAWETKFLKQDVRLWFKHKLLGKTHVGIITLLTGYGAMLGGHGGWGRSEDDREETKKLTINQVEEERQQRKEILKNVKDIADMMRCWCFIFGVDYQKVLEQNEEKKERKKREEEEEKKKKEEEEEKKKKAVKEEEMGKKKAVKEEEMGKKREEEDEDEEEEEEENEDEERNKGSN